MINTKSFVYVDTKEVFRYWQEAEEIASESDGEFIAALTCTLLRGDHKRALIVGTYMDDGYPDMLDKSYTGIYSQQDIMFNIREYGNNAIISFDN